MASQSTIELAYSSPHEALQQHSQAPVDSNISDQQLISPRFIEYQTINRCFHWDQTGRKRFTSWTNLEGETIMALFQANYASTEEKQQATRIACGTCMNEYDIQFIFDLLLKKQTPVPPWQYPCEWTYLEFKLLRKELAASHDIDYEIVAGHMNHARENRHYVNKQWWRPGRKYTSDELRLATRLLSWRLPNLNVRASAAWFGVEDREFLASYSLCQSLSRLTNTLSSPPGQYLPNARNEVAYDRLSVERHVDVMLRNMSTAELKKRYDLNPLDLEFFGILGNGRGMAPAALEPWGVI